MSYRLTPQSTTGVSPAELLLGRQPRSKLDLLKPNTAERVEFRQQKQKASHDNASCSRMFAVGDPVYAKNFGQGQRWLSGEVTELTGPVSVMVTLNDGRLLRRHQDHIRIRKSNTQKTVPEATIGGEQEAGDTGDNPEQTITGSDSSSSVGEAEITPNSDPTEKVGPEGEESAPEPTSPRTAS